MYVHLQVAAPCKVQSLVNAAESGQICLYACSYGMKGDTQTLYAIMVMITGHHLNLCQQHTTLGTSSQPLQLTEQCRPNRPKKVAPAALSAELPPSGPWASKQPLLSPCLCYKLLVRNSTEVLPGAPHHVLHVMVPQPFPAQLSRSSVLQTS